MDLYDKHAKCAYLQAVKHPIFVLEHKHTSHREGMAYQAATQPQFKASFSPTSTTPLLLPVPAFPGTGDLVGDFTGDFTVALNIADTGKVHQVAGHAGEVGQVIPAMGMSLCIFSGSLR